MDTTTLRRCPRGGKRRDCRRSRPLPYRKAAIHPDVNYRQSRKTGSGLSGIDRSATPASARLAGGASVSATAAMIGERRGHGITRFSIAPRLLAHVLPH